MRQAAPLVFWALALILVSLDHLGADRPRLEPPPIALGSGQLASGGHCSGR